ncbi:MAG: START-like domain-containing protein [Flavobacteriales bacterium]
MAYKERYELEFILHTTRGVLYKQISTPSGLAEWFADDVKVEEDRFIFMWEDEEERAVLLEEKGEEFIRFRWEGDEADHYFEFRIRIDPLTEELALIITDFSEPEELDANKELWSSQIDGLRHSIGA